MEKDAFRARSIEAYVSKPSYPIYNWSTFVCGWCAAICFVIMANMFAVHVISIIFSGMTVLLQIIRTVIYLQRKKQKLLLYLALNMVSVAFGIVAIGSLVLCEMGYPPSILFGISLYCIILFILTIVYHERRVLIRLKQGYYITEDPKMRSLEERLAISSTGILLGVMVSVLGRFLPNLFLLLLFLTVSSIAAGGFLMYAVDHMMKYYYIKKYDLQRCLTIRRELWGGYDETYLSPFDGVVDEEPLYIQRMKAKKNKPSRLEGICKACLSIPVAAFVVNFICMIIGAIISSETGQSDFYVVPKALMFGTPIPCLILATVGMNYAKKLKLQGIENTKKYTVLGIAELAWFGFASVLTVLYFIV